MYAVCALWREVAATHLRISLSEVRHQNMKLKEPSVDGGCTTENKVVFANQHQVSHLQEFHMMSPWSCNQYDPLLDIKESGEKAMASMTVQPS